mgnify:CR=1 FL=1
MKKKDLIETFLIEFMVALLMMLIDVLAEMVAAS